MVDKKPLVVSKYYAKELFKLAGLGVVDAVFELPRTDSNFLFQILSSNKFYFLRVFSPGTEKKTVFDKLMFNNEVETHKVLYALKGMHSPKVLFSGESEENSLRFYITEGYEITYQKSVPTIRERRRILFQAGADLARTHAVKGAGFGYEKMGLENSWETAYKKIIDKILAEATLNDIKVDAVRINKIIERAVPILEKVESRLVHLSLDKTKIYVSKSLFSYQGLIGWETAMWGDIAGDFVVATPFAPVNNKYFKRGYSSVSSLALDEELIVRINLMKLFRGLKLLIETRAKIDCSSTKGKKLLKKAKNMISQAIEFLENPFPANI